MSKKLPTVGFEWLPSDRLETALKDRLWPKVPGVYKVDVKVPKHLHDFFSDLPLVPERRVFDGVEKLITSLYDKEKYVVHYENLKYYEDKGLVVTKVHRVITFNE